jgi:hypothetical protein
MSWPASHWRSASCRNSTGPMLSHELPKPMPWGNALSLFLQKRTPSSSSPAQCRDDVWSHPSDLPPRRVPHPPVLGFPSSGSIPCPSPTPAPCLGTLIHRHPLPTLVQLSKLDTVNTSPAGSLTVFTGHLELLA